MAKSSQSDNLLKLLLVVIVLATVAALSVSLISFGKANENQSEMKSITAALSKQTEILSQMSNQPSAKEVSAVVLGEIEKSRLAEMLKPYEKIAGDFENAKSEVDADSNIYGDEGAEISIVEFSDFDCPYCQRFHETPKQVVDQSGGRVNWVFKHFPVHASARPLHVATECVAEQDNQLFWAATQLIFDGGGSREIKPEELGQMLPLNQEAYTKCLAGRSASQSVQTDYNFGQEAGVTGTPATFVIHNRTNQVLELKGAVPASKVKAAARQLIEAAANASKSDNTNS